MVQTTLLVYCSIVDRGKLAMTLRSSPWNSKGRQKLIQNVENLNHKISTENVNYHFKTL